MKVRVELKETSQSLQFDNATNTYTKGDLYCVYQDGVVTKFPLANIWRIKEDYA
jgi:hypothetical protein